MLAYWLIAVIMARLKNEDIMGPCDFHLSFIEKSLVRLLTMISKPSGRGFPPKPKKKAGIARCPLNPNNQTCGCSLNQGAQRPSPTGFLPVQPTKPNNHRVKTATADLVQSS